MIEPSAAGPGPAALAADTGGVVQQDGAIDLLLPFLVNHAWLRLDPVPTGHVLGGMSRAVAVARDTVFVGVGKRLVAFRIAPGGRPVWVGTVALNARVMDLAVHDGLAYVAAGDVFVADVSDPTRMAVLSRVNLRTYRDADVVAVHRGHLYVATFEDVEAYSLAEPRAPRWVATVGPDLHANDLAAWGGHLCVASGVEYDGALRVLDIADPSSMREAASMPVEGLVNGVTASASTCSLAAHEGVDVFAVSAASDGGIRRLSSVLLGGEVDDIARRGAWLYALVHDGREAGGRVVALDARRPEAVGVAGSARLPWRGSERSLRLATGEDGRAYAVGGVMGLRSVDLADPALPRVVRGFDFIAEAEDVAVDADHAYVADRYVGLRIVRLEGAEPARVVATLDVGDYAEAVDVEDGIAYVGAREGLHIVDVSEPARPRAIATLPQVDSAQSVRASAGIAYVARSARALSLVDVSDPHLPRVVSTVPMTRSAHAVAVAGRYAFVAGQAGEILGVDAADPFDPRVVGSVALQRVVYGLDHADGTLYAATLGGRLMAIDASRPSAMRIVGETAIRGSAVDVEVDGAGRAYVVSGFEDENGDFVGRLTVVDVRDPARPREVGRHGLPSLGRGVSLWDGHAVSAAGREGLVLAQLAP